MTEQQAKTALLGLPGVIGVRRDSSGFVVYVRSEVTVVPAELGGYAISKRVTGRIVASRSAGEA